MYKGKNKTKTTPLRSNWTLLKILIVFAILAGITLVVLWSAHVNIHEVQKQMQQNLTDVAMQNGELLHSKFHAEHELLLALSNELDDVTPDTIEEKLGHLEILLEELHLKRFAYCFADGTTYSTDGKITNLEFREFFRRGMEGKCSITGTLSDAIRSEDSLVNVMTIPLSDEEENIIGVFGLAYDAEIFNESLQIDSFDGQGFSCIIDEKGVIMATGGNSNFALSQNLFDNILEADEKNQKPISDIQKCMNQKTTGSGIMYLNDEFYYSCVPVSLMDGSVTWYAFTIVPNDVLAQRVSPILTVQYISSFCILLLVLLGALTVIVLLKKQHNQMLALAYEDPVTHGANYASFCIEMNRLHNPSGFLIAMDIANFNNLSIVAGQTAGDTLIREAWSFIESSLQKEETACHIRDNSFLIFLRESEEHSPVERMEQISEQIASTAKNFHVYGIRTGYGIYRMSGNDTLENAYSKAKIAKEYTKNSPDLYHMFYDEVNLQKMQRQKQLEEQFPAALAQEEFEVWYQPKYSASNYTVVGSEALVRWRQNNGEMISPGEFIPLFESNGMIMKLDEYMFRAVCRQQKEWLQAGKHIYPVSINMSRATLYCMDVEQRYRSILEEYDMDPAYIQLEITETVMEKGADICELLNKFRKIGIKILMDDFGTGYSSFATLSTQCFDTLKLDKSLIDHIGNKNGETMLYHIIRMGQQIGLHITAEGVEKEAQLAFLQNLECDDIQGFYFSKPLPVSEYEAILQKETI